MSYYTKSKDAILRTFVSVERVALATAGKKM